MWRARSRLERWLIVVSGILIVCVLTLLLCLAGGAPAPRVLHVEPSSSSPCLTPNCIHAASAILRAIDTTVDPCEDFYAYACNQWIRRNPIPDGKSMWGTFGALEQQNQLVLKNALERPESQLK